MLAITPSGEASRLGPARPGPGKGSSQPASAPAPGPPRARPQSPAPGGGSAGPPSRLHRWSPAPPFPVPAGLRPQPHPGSRSLHRHRRPPTRERRFSPARGGPRRVPASAARGRDAFTEKNVGLFFSEYAPGTRHND